MYLKRVGISNSRHFCSKQKSVFFSHPDMDVSKNRATPKWMVYFMENPYEQMDELGGITPIFGNIHIMSKGHWFRFPSRIPPRHSCKSQTCERRRWPKSGWILQGDGQISEVRGSFLLFCQKDVYGFCLYIYIYELIYIYIYADS